MALHRGHLHADRRLHAERALTAAAVVLLLAGPAAAQISVEVSPLRIEMQATPGSSTTQAITVTNAGSAAVRVRGTVTDWDLSKEGAPQFEGSVVNGPFSATAWLRIAPPELVIEPGQQGTVRYSLSVPGDLQPGGYRTGVLFEFGPASGDPVARARQVSVKSRIATLIYVNVGQPPLAAELTDLAVRMAGAQTHVVASVKNTSRRSVRTKGSLTVYDEAGRVVRELAVPDVPLLPQSERFVAIPVVDERNPSLPSGAYRVELKLDLGLPALIVGETILKVPR